MKKFWKKVKAFTITELVIVIAVIAILASVLIPTFSNVIENAHESTALQTCNHSLQNYIGASSTDPNHVPGSEQGMVFHYNGYYYAYINQTLTKVKPNIVKTSAEVLSYSIADENIERPYNITEDEHKVKLYTYSVTVNGTTYNGFFGITNNDKSYQSEGADYSKVAVYEIVDGVQAYTIKVGDSVATATSVGGAKAEFALEVLPTTELALS